LTQLLVFGVNLKLIYSFKVSNVKPLKDSSNSSITEIIESRSPAGRQDSVQGWHNLLKRLLSQMTPYLKNGHLVTFRTLNDRERDFFEELHGKVTVPPSVSAIYMPPSVRFQMLYRRPEGEPRAVPDHSPENPPDEGIVLGCRKTDLNVVINALLAKPPFAPAIDVYDNGQLLAGYVYNTVDECIGDLTKVLQTHLKPEADLK
jgi:hypothetical protein